MTSTDTICHVPKIKKDLHHSTNVNINIMQMLIVDLTFPGNFLPNVHKVKLLFINIKQ